MILNLLKKYRQQIVLSILLGYCVILIIFSSISMNSVLMTNPIDKLLHFGAYAMLSIPFYLTLTLQDKIILLKKYPGISTFLLVFLFGFLNELHQIFIASRTFNKFDILANLLGSLVVIILIKFTIKNIIDLKI